MCLDEAIDPPTIIIHVMSLDDMCYIPNFNVINITSDKGETEEDTINGIVHEVDHWAQFAFLDQKEREFVSKRYLMMKLADFVPFLEKINRFPSKSWARAMKKQGYKRYTETEYLKKRHWWNGG